MEDDDSLLAPRCPTERMPMIATIAGWRCPVCGLAALPGRVLDEPPPRSELG